MPIHDSSMEEMPRLLLALPQCTVAAGQDGNGFISWTCAAFIPTLSSLLCIYFPTSQQDACHSSERVSQCIFSPCYNPLFAPLKFTSGTARTHSFLSTRPSPLTRSVPHRHSRNRYQLLRPPTNPWQISTPTSLTLDLWVGIRRHNPLLTLFKPLASFQEGGQGIRRSARWICHPRLC